MNAPGTYDLAAHDGTIEVAGLGPSPGGGHVVVHLADHDDVYRMTYLLVRRFSVGERQRLGGDHVLAFFTPDLATVEEGQAFRIVVVNTGPLPKVVHIVLRRGRGAAANLSL
jgi:hypothetical protein